MEEKWHLRRRELIKLFGLMSVGEMCSQSLAVQPQEKEKTKAEPPVEIDLTIAPRLLAYSQPFGGVPTLQGVVAAIWSDGQVVKCANVEQPGKNLTTGNVDKAIVKCAITAIEALDIHNSKYQDPRVPASAGCFTLCIYKAERLSRLQWTIPLEIPLNDYSFRFLAARNMMSLLCMNASKPISNSEKVIERIQQLAYHLEWNK